MMLTVVTDCPTNVTSLESLQKLKTKLGTLPDGVQQVAENVWLVDPRTDADFLFLIQKTAGLDSSFRVYSSAPKPPTAA